MNALLRRFRRSALPPALAALALAAGACDPNSNRTLLAPTGELPQPAIGVISGKLDFGTPGTFPRSLVMIARVKNASFHSSFTTIQVVGTPTGFNIAQSPRLTQLAPGFWVDTTSVPSGTFEWKFVTNGAFDNPPDYGKPGGQVDGLVGEAVLGAAGPDGNIVANVGAAEAGPLLCTLDETASPAPYGFVPIGSTSDAAYTSTVDGSFAIANLVPGTYNVLVRSAAGSRTFTNVTVGGTGANLGTIGMVTFAITASAGAGGTIAPSGAVTVFSGENKPFTITPDFGFAVDDVLVDGVSVGAVTSYTFNSVAANHTIAASFVSSGPQTGGVQGTLAWDPTIHPDLASAPWPPTTLQLFQGATKVGETVTDKFTNTYSFSSLPAGTYRLRWDAWQFARDSMDVTVGTSVVTQDVTLAADINELSSNLHVAGDFNGFTLADSTQMSLVALAVWEYAPSHPIAAGTYNLKFVTDGSFDNPTDYGGDESVTIVAPVTNADTRLVSGIGTALKVQIPSSGNYRFRLDERRLTFSVESVPAPGLSRPVWRRSRP